MRLQTFAIIVFAACLMEFLMGFNPAFTNLNAAQGVLTNPTAFLQLVAGNMISIAVLGSALLLIAAVSIFTGFSAVFVIPLLILLVVVNWFVFPQELLGGTCHVIVSAGASCPTPTFIMPIVVFLNLCAILTYIEFVRGPS